VESYKPARRRLWYADGLETIRRLGPRLLRVLVLGALFSTGLAVVQLSVAAAKANVALYVDGAFAGTSTAGCASQSNPCKSISQGVAAADGLASSNVTIHVAGGTYSERPTLNVPLSDALSIQGAGSATTTVNGGGAGSTITVVTGNATITGVTITGGSAVNGGGVLTDAGTLVTLNDDTITGNQASNYGGGIYEGGGLILTNDVVSNNTATKNGGGYIEWATSTHDVVTVTGDTFSGNAAGIVGGGAAEESDLVAVTFANDIFSHDTSVQSGGGLFSNWTTTLTNDTFDHDTAGFGGTAYGAGGGFSTLAKTTLSGDVFSNDKALDGEGGGIDSTDVAVLSDVSFLSDSAGTGGGASLVNTVTGTGLSFTNDTSTGSGGGAFLRTDGASSIDDATFSSDSATVDGGAAYLRTDSGRLTIRNSTFDGSTASQDGGGIYAAGVASAVNDTFSNDTAVQVGGGITVPSGGSLTLSNSLLAQNSTLSATAYNCSGTVVDGGHNVADDASCGFGSTSLSNSATVGPLALAANGSIGPMTDEITTTSSAFDVVPLAACTVKLDERGLPRPGTGVAGCDAGAYEYQGLPQAISGFTVPESAEVGSSTALSATSGPSGNPVSFRVDPSTKGGICAVTSSILRFTGGGTCKVDANQAGNVTYQNAPEVVGAVVVQKLPTRTRLVVPKPRITYGHEQVERLGVVVSDSGPTIVVSGAVSISSAGIRLCVAHLSNGKGSCSLTAKALSPGAHRLTATFAGSAPLDASRSASVTVTVVK